ncbi:hypothetical protein C8F04DRAFT_1248652 [Mycena alexandri]|uniref:Uncharacterized protein n=1 Tax=Mycena alexandri TaxID=1745969 RepID=A0AAD6TH12_9AGAR|nr:hypothetical protein C8F04DRAFT_1248652 [Mycena alexandri]
MSSGQQPQQLQHDPNRWVHSPKGVFYWRHDVGSYWKGPPDDRVWVPSMDTPLQLPPPPDFGAAQGDAAGAPPAIQFGSNPPINTNPPMPPAYHDQATTRAPQQQTFSPTPVTIPAAAPAPAPMFAPGLPPYSNRGPPMMGPATQFPPNNSGAGFMSMQSRATPYRASAAATRRTRQSETGSSHVGTARGLAPAHITTTIASANGDRGTTPAGFTCEAIIARAVIAGPVMTIAHGSMYDGTRLAALTPKPGARIIGHRPTNFRKGHATISCVSVP